MSNDLGKVFKAAFNQQLRGRREQIDPMTRCAEALEKIWRLLFWLFFMLPLCGLILYIVVVFASYQR